MTNYNDINRMTIKRINAGDALSLMVEKINFDFDQILMYGGKKGDKGDKGDQGIPGATKVGQQGDKGDKGTIMWFHAGPLADSQMYWNLFNTSTGIPNPTPYNGFPTDWRVEDVVVDINGSYYNIIQASAPFNPDGVLIFKLKFNINSALLTQYFTSEGEYDRTGVIKRYRKNWDNVTEINKSYIVPVRKRGADISEYYSVMIGMDEHQPTTNCALFIANLLEGDLDADLDTTPFAQVGLKYRKRPGDAYVSSNTFWWSYIETGIDNIGALKMNGSGVFLREDKVNPAGTGINDGNATIIAGKNVDIIGELPQQLAAPSNKLRVIVDSSMTVLTSDKPLWISMDTIGIGKWGSTSPTIISPVNRVEVAEVGANTWDFYAPVGLYNKVMCGKLASGDIYISSPDYVLSVGSGKQMIIDVTDSSNYQKLTKIVGSAKCVYTIRFTKDCSVKNSANLKLPYNRNLLMHAQESMTVYFTANNVCEVISLSINTRNVVTFSYYGVACPISNIGAVSLESGVGNIYQLDDGSNPHTRTLTGFQNSTVPDYTEIIIVNGNCTRRLRHNYAITGDFNKMMLPYGRDILIRPGATFRMMKVTSGGSTYWKFVQMDMSEMVTKYYKQTLSSNLGYDLRVYKDRDRVSISGVIVATATIAAGTNLLNVHAPYRPGANNANRVMVSSAIAIFQTNPPPAPILIGVANNGNISLLNQLVVPSHQTMAVFVNNSYELDSLPTEVYVPANNDGVLNAVPVINPSTFDQSQQALQNLQTM